MLFSQFLAKFWPQKSKQRLSKNASKRPVNLKKLASIQEGLFPEHNNLNTKRKLNQALKNIEKLIQDTGTNNQLIIQKADILIRKKKFNQARQILNKIAQDKNDQKASDLAKKLMAVSQKMKRKEAVRERKKFIKDLFEIAKKYDYEIINLSKSEHSSLEIDIPLLVRKAARQARTSDLPNLSRELIDQTLQAGYQSPWLLHDKALSLLMMGQRAKALSILKELQGEGQGEKLTTSIVKTIRFIKNNPKHDQSKINARLAKQSIRILKSSDHKETFSSELIKAGHETNVKILILKQARCYLKKDPQTTLNLCSSVLDYIPGDSKSLQLKGEALARLRRNDEAIEIWKELNQSENKKAALKIFDLISQNIINKAQLLSSKKSPKAAVVFFIKEHLRYKITPSMNKQISKIVFKLNQRNENLICPELQKDQLELLFNTLVVDYIEMQMRKQGRLDNGSAAQKPRTIRKTVQKAG